MLLSCKGVPRFTHDAFEVFDPNGVYKWFAEEGITNGQICEAPAWYEKNSRWYLKSAVFDPSNEVDSMWFARDYPHNGRQPIADTYVQKFFQLEKGENLIATHGKKRLVILVRYIESPWFNTVYPKKSWLCIPLFSYKGRHSQRLVLEDQKFNSSDRVYLPPAKGPDAPGISYESAAHILSMQLIEEKYITPIMKKNTNNNLDQGIGVSEFALKLIIFHLFNGTSLISNVLGQLEQQTAYELVKEHVSNAIDSAFKRNS